MRFGSIQGIDRPVARIGVGLVGHDRQQTVDAVLDAYAQAGGNLLDSAWAYGDGFQDRALGDWARRRGLVDDIVVAAKVGARDGGRPELIRAHLDETLDRLQRPYVEVVVLHQDDERVPVGDFVDALVAECDRGAARCYGLSNWTMDRVRSACADARERGLPGPAILSNHFSLARWHTPPWPRCVQLPGEAFGWLEERGVAHLAWSAQAHGYFSGATPDATVNGSWDCARNRRARTQATAIARRHASSPTAIALGYVLQRSSLSFAVVGPANPAELRDSLQGCERELTPHELAALETCSCE